jgi:hypothetical protein
MSSHSSYEVVYQNGLLDDLHNIFPAILYEPERFTSIHSFLMYITEQTANYANLYTRNMRSYRRRYAVPPPTASVNVSATETIDITPLFTATPQGIIPPTGGGGLLDLLNIFRSVATPPPQMTMEPVRVAPTQETIDAATTLRQATIDDELNQCAICQDAYTEGQAIRCITHCSHIFHRMCIDEWFERNVRCPTCRFDIREHAVNQREREQGQA